MADILKDRNYYRMLSDDELKDRAYREKNELAITLLERKRGIRYYNTPFAHGGI